MGHSVKKEIILKANHDTTASIKWIGSHDPEINVPQLAHKSVYFYYKCIVGPLTLNVGDFVLVSNADAKEPDTVEGCDIAKILYLYELKELSDKDPYRAIVQWYSRPECIPQRHYDADDICIDFGKEIIEEYRPYDSDISVEAIFRKCSVLYGTVDYSAEVLLGTSKNKRDSCPIFVCRYKYMKLKNSYQLVPLQFNNEKVDETNSVSAKKAAPPNTVEKEIRKRRASMKVTNYAQFLDDDYFNNENKVSPIKIIGRCGVVRQTTTRGKNTPNRRKDDALSPLTERNIKDTPKSLSTRARRNLNLSLEAAEANNTADSDCLNYSIVKEVPDTEKLESEMKIKLRISQRQRSKRSASAEQDPLALDDFHSNEHNSNDIYKSPPKKLKETESGTHNDKRKSILRSASSRSDYGTPKRNIQLSNIVHQRVFMGNEMISTPKSNQRRKYMGKASEEESNASVEVYTPRKSSRRTSSNDPSYEPHTPKKHVQKTPNKAGKSAKNFNVDNVANHRENNDVPSLELQTYINCTPSRKRISALDSREEENFQTPKKALQKTPSTRSKTTDNLQTPKTPREKLKMIRSGQITPSIKQRTNIAAQNDVMKTDLDVARERLHVSVVPNSLPCREREFNEIYTFLASKIQDQCGGCMYISGVPGTGKTATVTAVIRALQKQSAQEQLPPFEYLEINGMRLTEPRQAYVHIYRQLTGKTVSWEHAQSLLEKRFTTPAPRRITTVLLVDELDILCNRRQDVVYNLLDWPTKATARLVVITIANTMDLPERLLRGKVTSRLGLTRLTFQPYTHKHLQEIVVARLQGSTAFKGDAIQLVARKVAAVSGDARRALDICRRATEIADTVMAVDDVPSDASVRMLHVQQALTEMIASAKVQAIKNCSRLEKMFLQAVVAEYSRTGVEEMSFLAVYTQLETITAIMGVRKPTTGQALLVCNKLGSARLIIGEHSRNDLFQKILLNVSTDDVHYALKLTNDLI